MPISKWICLSLCCWMLGSLWAQSDSPDIPTFINWDDNVLYRDSDAPLQGFFSSLDSLILFGDRKVSVLHLGDSHIQAGFFSNEVRVQFQRHFFLGNGGRGMVFPYKMAQTNGPLNYGIDYRGRWSDSKLSAQQTNAKVGIAGYAAETRDTNSLITVYVNHKAHNPTYTISRVKVFHDTGPRALTPYLKDADVIEVISDSHFTEFVLLSDTDVVTLALRQDSMTQESFRFYGISLENEDPGVVYHSFGVNGADIPDWLACPLLEDHLQVLQPTLIIISLGTNDAYMKYFNKEEYLNNYKALMARLRKGAPNASIILTTPGDSYRYRRYFNNNNIAAREAVFELAKAENLSVWDFFTVMGGPNSVDKWYSNGLASADKLHLTQRGYQLKGKLLFEAIMRAYFAYLDKAQGE